VDHLIEMESPSLGARVDTASLCIVAGHLRSDYQIAANPSVVQLTQEHLEPGGYYESARASHPRSPSASMAVRPKIEARGAVPASRS